MRERLIPCAFVLVRCCPCKTRAGASYLVMAPQRHLANATHLRSPNHTVLQYHEVWCGAIIKSYTYTTFSSFWYIWQPLKCLSKMCVTAQKCTHSNAHVPMWPGSHISNLFTVYIYIYYINTSEIGQFCVYGDSSIYWMYLWCSRYDLRNWTGFLSNILHPQHSTEPLFSSYARLDSANIMVLKGIL